MAIYKILIIDDDKKIGEELISFLQDFNHQAMHIADSTLAEAQIDSFRPDIILLDIMMPKIDGFELCKSIRKTSQIPIIFLSARSEVMDRVIGLEIGADDYLPKPFEPRELLARIDSVLRRSSQQSTLEEHLDFEELSINLNARTVKQNNLLVSLTTMEFELLSLFVKNNQKKFTRDEIMNYLQGIDDNVYSRSVDVLVSRLRQKLKDDQKTLIETVWGTGYFFNATKK